MNIPKLIEELERDERMELKPYVDDKGKTTIGIGRNLTDGGISREEAYHMLNHDIERTIADLDQYLPWWRQLDEVRQRVIANMAFNLGVSPQSRPPGKLTGFTQTLALIRSKAFSLAADHMLLLPWAAQVGPRARRLSEMMKRGLDPV